MVRLVLPEVKRPDTVDELTALVKAQKNEDVVSRIGDLKLENDRLVVGSTAYALRENGFKGLLSELGMPFGYAASIPNDLLYDSVNRLCKTYGDTEVMLRSQNGELRGVLSPNYVPLDSDNLVEHIKEASNKGLSLARVLYDGDGLVASMTTEQKVHVKDVGDISQIGVTLSTSDVGKFELSANPYFMRLVCTNGCVMPMGFGGEISFNQRKVSPDSVWGFFKEGYQRILNDLGKIDSEFLIRLESNKVDAKGLVKAKEKLSNFASGRVLSKVLKEIEAGITEGNKEYSYYDLLNEVTRAARDTTDLYVSKSLEKAAGQLLLIGASN